MSMGIKKIPVILFIVFFVASCTCPPAPKKEEVTGPGNALVKLEKKDLPRFSDDLDAGSLATAIGKSLHYFQKLPKDRVVHYGEDARTVGEETESLETFLKLIESGKLSGGLNQALLSQFDIYEPPSTEKKEEPVLFTGYYEPILEGSRERTDLFAYPLYQKPPDLLTLNLEDFHPSFQGKKLVGRIGNGTLLPYHDRGAIDGKAVLAGTGLELAWLADPIDLFFLHIQGSGKIRFRDGGLMNVNYAASNGRVYRSIGKKLIEEGILPKEEVNLESIKKFLREHPKERDRVLQYNESYVFFRQVAEGPVGSLSEPVTAGRSIATDSVLFPKGALAYIETSIPVLDEAGGLKGWKKISRFVLNQDTGGAIQGPGRVDLFFGSGDKAGKAAGFMNQRGRLYFLIKKKDAAPGKNLTRTSRNQN